MAQMGWLARQDGYDLNAFDVPGEQSTGVGWANRLGEILTTRPPDNPAVAYKTPYFDITEGDIGRATEAALGGMTVTPKGIKAYHSSPHDFDKFDLAKIGTGEGAQVYGHGLYFAESPAVSGQGGEYWKQFQRKFSGDELAASIALKQSNFDRAEAIAKARDDLAYMRQRQTGLVHPGANREGLAGMIAGAERELALLESRKPVGPRTYEVNINADPAHMLDWDKVIAANDPLRQVVAGSARTAFDRATTGANRNIAKDALLAAESEHLTGQGVYEQLARTNTRPGLFPEINIKQPARASEMLREAGIPGIKYLDQGSRGMAKQADELLKIYETPERVREVAQQAVARGEDADYWQSILRGLGDRSHNYVIFDPGLIDIMKKYGIAGAAPVGMGALAAQDRYE